jgi:hypothetical protein
MVHVKYRQENVVAMASVILLLILPAIIPFVRAESININLGVLSSDNSKYYGFTYGEWTSKWWQWALSIPSGDNPGNDATGKNCAQKQNNPNVWFLAGTFGGNAERECTIPAGKAILFPIIIYECSYAEYPASKTESDLLSCAKSQTDHVTNLAVSVDGVNIPDLQRYRVQSALFNFTFPRDNVYGVAEGLTQAVSDGFWVFLKPLSPGKHEIHFSGVSQGFTATSNLNFAIDVKYHLTVL